MPDQPPAAAPVADLVAWARSELAQEQAGAHDLGPVAQACLELTAGHPASVADLLASGVARLSALLRDGESRPVHLLRVRRFRLAVADLADHGLRGGYLVAGLVDLGHAQVPVLLKPCVVQPAGANDAVITLSGAWRLNPALVDAVAGAAGEADRVGEATEATEATEAGGVGDVADDVAGDAADDEVRRGLSELGVATTTPDAAVDHVATVLAGVGLSVARRLVLAPVTLDSERTVRDLERVTDLIADHPILAALSAVVVDEPVPGEPAGATEAAPRRVERRRAALPGGHVAAAALDAAMDDVLATPLDADQRMSLRHVLSGLSLIVDAPPATGATTLAADVAVLAVTTGRRCLVLTPTRTQGDLVVERLRRAGVAERLVTDGSAVTGPVTGGADGAGEAAAADGGAGATVADVEGGGTEGGGTGLAGPGPDAVRRERDAAAAAFAAARHELTAQRAPWQVSRLDAFDALARLDSEPVDITLVWPAGPSAELPVAAVSEVIDAVVRALDLGAASHGSADSPWAAASLEEPFDASEALDLAERISDPLAHRVRAAIADLASLTGTAPATTVTELVARRKLFLGLQRTLDRLTPEAFDIPVLDLVAATGDHGFRGHGGQQMSAITRRRLLARARRLVRPGVVVKRSELHDLLVLASEQRMAWQALSGGAGWAHVPADVPEQIRVMTEFVDACAQLGRLHPAFVVGSDPSVEGAITLATQLVAAAGDVEYLPEVSRLQAVWVDAGLAPLVEELFVQWRALPAGRSDRAGTAVWRAYWTAIAAATAPREQSADTSGLLRRYAEQDDEYRRCASARARAAIRTAGTQTSQVRVAVPADVADLPADERYDVLVIDAAGEIPLPRAVAAIARAGQVVVLGDAAHADPDSVLRRMQAVQPPIVHRRVLRQRHRPVVILHAAGGGTRDSPTEIDMADASDIVTFTHLSDAVGLPTDGEDHIESSEVEVAHVVERALVMAEEAVGAEPPRSLAVVALTRTHAAAIALGLRAALRADPERAALFTADTDEPVIVVSADQARGLERDLVLLSVGLPRTPHGRVLHRFGPLETGSGPGLVATAVTRARRELHVVSGLRSADLDPSRLYSPGARAVSALLVGAELASAAAAAARPEPPEESEPSEESDTPAGTPGQAPIMSGGLDASVLQLIAGDVRERGLAVGPGAGGGGLTVTGPGGRRIVVNLDVGFADAAAALHRQRRLDEGGWVHILLSVEAVAADRVATATRIADLVASARPVRPRQPARPDPMQPDPPSVDPPAQRSEAAQPDLPQPDLPQPDPPQPEPDPPHDPEPTLHPAQRPSTGHAQPMGAVTTSSVDDSDVGWGEPPPSDENRGRDDPIRDDRIRDDRPPHW